MTALADLLKGDSALHLYFSEGKNFRGIYIYIYIYIIYIYDVYIYMCVCVCVYIYILIQMMNQKNVMKFG